ncbi:MAG: transposase, partial [Planctomycetaceae bacterium]
MEPLQNVARSRRAHQTEILNWFRAKGVSSAGVVEGLQGKAKRTKKKADGFRTSEALQVALD